MSRRKKAAFRALTAGLAWMCLQSAPAIAADPEIAAAAVLEDHYPRQKVSFAGGVTGFSNLIFSQIVGYRPITLDLYVPEAKPGPGGRPLVLYVHGGGWNAGHSRNSGAFVDFPGVLAGLAAKGYVVASVNYRLSGEAPFPAAIQDVKAAIRWLRAHAGEYGIDKSRALVWGGSAGGQLAGLVATSCNVAALEPAKPVHPEESACVQGAVLWYPVMNFETTLKQQTSTADVPSENSVSRYLACSLKNCLTQAADTIRLASPQSMVSATTPPVLMIHGIDDNIVPISQSQDFLDKMKTAGAKAELVAIPGVNHSFIGKTPDATRQASLQALGHTVAFIEATLGK